MCDADPAEERDAKDLNVSQHPPEILITQKRSLKKRSEKGGATL